MQETQNLFGKVILLRGDFSLVKRLCVSLSLKLQDISDVVFIDTCNMFDVMHLKKVNKEVMLKRISIARPFDFAHMRRLLAAVETSKSKAIIISSLDGLFASRHPKDSALMLMQVLAQAKILAKKKGLVVIIGYEGMIPFELLENYVDCTYMV